MKTFVALALAGVASAITQNDIKYMDYLATQGKGYATISEFNFRAALFAKRDSILAKINENPEHTFTVGHNFLSDWTEEEKSKLHQTYPEESDDEDLLNMATAYTIKYPSSIDWKAKGAVTAIKYQGGSCGSCWAFSAVAGIEGSWFQQTGQLMQLSEQQIIDCNPLGQGCNGGAPENAYDYATTNKIQKDSKYPYVKKQGTCRANGTGATIAGRTRGIRLSVGGLKTAIARGPTSVSVASSEPIFDGYKEGVINDAAACGTRVNHGVTAIGYNSQYYLIKNSWSVQWGEKGFGRIAINGDGNGVCGIQTSIAIPYIM